MQAENEEKSLFQVTPLTAYWKHVPLNYGLNIINFIVFFTKALFLLDLVVLIWFSIIRKCITKVRQLNYYFRLFKWWNIFSLSDSQWLRIQWYIYRRPDHLYFKLRRGNTFATGWTHFLSKIYALRSLHLTVTRDFLVGTWLK